VWGSSPVSPALGKLKQEDGEFEASIGYPVGVCHHQQHKPMRKKISYFQKNHSNTDDR
jgi:hemerythrin